MKIEKLVSLVPPPRAHQVRYHGVLAPSAGRRAKVVPRVAEALAPPGAISVPEDRELPAPEAIPCSGSGQLKGGRGGPLPEPPGSPERSLRPGPPGRPRRLPWAELMRRVFAVDVLQCPTCAGPMRILTAIHDPDAARAILESMGLPSRAPPNHPARPDPKEDFIA